jgi:hypothetical protein
VAPNLAHILEAQSKLYNRILEEEKRFDKRKLFRYSVFPSEAKFLSISHSKKESQIKLGESILRNFNAIFVEDNIPKDILGFYNENFIGGEVGRQQLVKNKVMRANSIHSNQTLKTLQR